MSFSVLNNFASIQAQNELTTNNVYLQKTLSQLSSGKRIVTGADDAAGLAMADGLKGQVNALNQAIRNASEGIGYLQTADGALGQITSLLHRAITLAESATSSGTITASTRLTINSEFTQIRNEINRIHGNTFYNGTSVFSTSLTVFVGDTSSTSSIFVDTTNYDLTVGGSSGSQTINDITLSSSAGAMDALAILNTAIKSVAGWRGEVGAYVNRMQSASSVIMTQVQNLTAAESGIRDANMAQVMSELTKYNILNQAGMSALSQANSNAQNVLTLFR